MNGVIALTVIAAGIIIALWGIWRGMDYLDRIATSPQNAVVMKCAAVVGLFLLTPVTVLILLVLALKERQIRRMAKGS